MTEYEELAYKFLTKYKIKMTITLLGNRPARWTPHGLCYQVTMRKFTPTNKQCSFRFWDSLANKEQEEFPTAYDILACLSSEISFDDPEDIVEELGGTLTDAKITARFAKKLQKFFTPQEQIDLSYIQ